MGRPYEPPTVRPGWRRWLSLKGGVLNIIFCCAPLDQSLSNSRKKTLEWGVDSLTGEGSRSRQSVVHFSSIVSVRPRSLDCTKSPQNRTHLVCRHGLPLLFSAKVDAMPASGYSGSSTIPRTSALPAEPPRDHPAPSCAFRRQILWRIDGCVCRI